MVEINPDFGKFTPRVIWPGGSSEIGLIPPPHGFDSWAAYYATYKGEGDVTIFASPGTIPKGRKVTMVWTRTGEDVATCGLHILRADGASVADMTDDDCSATEGRLLALWASIKDLYDPSIALDRFNWHEYGVGVRKPNPMIRDVSAGVVVGTAADDQDLPPQVAVSVTLKTSRRRNWGRVFLPAIAKENCEAGRIITATVNAIRTAFGTFLDAQAGASLPLVIWSPRHAGDALTYGPAAHADNLDNPDTSSFAMTVDQVQVDDLFDVIESRRFDKALVRATHTLGG